MGMGTVLRYGDIYITNCLTKEFDQEPVYDDSGTDLLYHKFTISVVGYVHGSSVVIGNTNEDGSEKNVGPAILNAGSIPVPRSGAAINETAVRAALNHPRQAFRLATGVESDSLLGGETLLECYPASNNDPADANDANLIDVNNGPQPRGLRITNISNNNVFRVEYRIEICKLECATNGSNGNGTGVLSNRWSLVEDVDDNFYTTRTIQGRLRIATSRVNALDFRAYVVPKLHRGFRRQSMRFEVSANGLTLDYTIIDRETAFTPPYPATSWAMRHTETTGNGMVSTGEVHVRLGGARDTEKQALISVAAAIIDSKLFGGKNVNKEVKQTHFIEQLMITDFYGDHENGVEAYCRVRHNGDPKQENPDLAILIGDRLHVIGKPLDKLALPGIAAYNIGPYDSTVAMDPFVNLGTRDGALFLADSFASHLQSACGVRTHNYNQGIAPKNPLDDQIEELRAPDPQAIQVEVYQSTTNPPAYIEPRNDDQFSAIYTHYRYESKYEELKNKIHLPVAKSNQPSNNPNQQPSKKTSIVVAVGPSMLRRVVRISAERIGAPPLLPPAIDIPDTVNTTNPNNQTLLRHVNVPEQPELTADDNWLYRFEAQYEYALDRPLESGESLHTGLIPWLTADAQNTLPSLTDALVYYDPNNTILQNVGNIA